MSIDVRKSLVLVTLAALIGCAEAPDDIEIADEGDEPVVDAGGVEQDASAPAPTFDAGNPFVPAPVDPVYDAGTSTSYDSGTSSSSDAGTSSSGSDPIGQLINAFSGILGGLTGGSKDAGAADAGP